MKCMILLSALVLVTACSDIPLPSNAPAFDQIQVGKTTRAEVSAAMGEPEERTLYNVGRLEIESLQYEDFRCIYKVKIAATPLTEPMVISKSVIPKQPTEQ